MLTGLTSATCRRRKVKCDEKKPQCGQCRRTGKQCEPSTVVFRHHQNPSLNRGRDSLGKYFSKDVSFDDSATWLAIPSTVSFVTVDPAADDQSGDVEIEQESTQHENAVENSSSGSYPTMNNIGTNQTFDGSSSTFNPLSPPSIDPLSPRSAVRNAAPFNNVESTSGLGPFACSPDERPSNYIDFILNPVSKNGVRSESVGGIRALFAAPGSSASPESYTDYHSSHLSLESRRVQPVETDPEVAFLLRHFSEQPGKWYKSPHDRPSPPPTKLTTGSTFTSLTPTSNMRSLLKPSRTHY